MKILVLSCSDSFDTHLRSKVEQEGVEIRFARAPDSLADVELIMVHAPSFTDSLEPLLQRLVDESSLPIVVAADNPVMAQMLQLSAYNIRAYFHSYMAGLHYRQMLEFVAAGQVWFMPTLLQAAMNLAHSALTDGEAASAEQGANLDSLTEREVTIAHAVAEGLSNKAIARRFDITERTVKAHLTHIYEKTSIHDRVSLALYVKGR